jgi:Bifunctional DNA primase/polymerase, N-terminal
MTDPVLDTALTLVHAGLSVIPIGAHKRPAIASWKGYQTRLPTPEEWTAWCAHRPCGLAIVLGAVSGNAEVIDVDDLSVLRPFYDLVEAMAPGLVARLVVVMTPTGGRHLYYRCASIQGNMKLAVNSNREVMIETRGEGGYALIPPSPAWCHPDHKEYVLRQGDLAAIPTITADERDILLNCARALTQYVEPERVYAPRQPTATDGTRPGDLFAAKVTWEDILIPHGWRVVGHRGEVTLWCRPGKKGGLSATSGYCGDHLYVFSSDAHPFEPERAYSKFTAFALLNCGGDFLKAARILAHQGYVKAHEGQTAARAQRFEGFRGFKGYRVYRGYQAEGAVSHG